jgi:superfamily II DNA or RNA helicase
LKVRLTADKNLIYVEQATEFELRQLRLSFNVRIRNHWNHPKVKAKIWDGYFNFFKKDKYIPVGLWKKLLDICDKYNITINKNFVNDIRDSSIKKEDIEEYFKVFFDGNKYQPRKYQNEAVYMFSKYKRIVAEMATSAGKTLIIYMVFQYINHLMKLRDEENFKMLIIVPNIQLVTQTFQDWLDYDAGKDSFRALMVSGETDHKDRSLDEYDVVIGTFQSLSKKPKDWFSVFECVFVDESQSAGAVSLKNILTKCDRAEYKLGISGTTKIKGDDAESFGIQEHLGPLLYKISPDHLIKNDFATPVNVKVFRLSYLDNENRQGIGKLANRKSFDKAKLLSLEKDLAIESKKRLKFILSLLQKTKNNALVLFGSVEKGYGKKIKDTLREMTSEKEVYYVDGGTPSENRNEYKKLMEEGDNKILVASFGTFATGISIKNLHYVFLVESFKSETIIKQSIGRGMRQLDGKDKVVIVDIVDDYRVLEERNGKTYLKKGQKPNYLYKQGGERLDIYKSEGYPIKVYKVSL